MTAPAARTLAEIVAEGRRLCAENEGKHRYCTMDPGPHAALRMLPALLAVAEAVDKREAPLRAAAREALTVLTRLADSAAYWSDYDVPVGLVAEVDAAKARLAGVLNG